MSEEKPCPYCGARSESAGELSFQLDVSEVVRELRAMPSSLNDALRQMDRAADVIERLRDSEDHERYEAGMYRYLYEVWQKRAQAAEGALPALVKALEEARDAITDAAQFIDAVKIDAEREGWWTTWDSEMRQKITAALTSIYPALASVRGDK